jgi:hypothetical protein
MNRCCGDRKVLKVSLILLLAFIGCRHNPEVPVSPIFTFNKDISSITLNNCATVGCHDGTSERRSLITYPDLMHYVTAGKPYSSKLFTTIIKLSGNKMPPNGPLSDPQIKSIYIWILQGAKEN